MARDCFSRIGRDLEYDACCDGRFRRPAAVKIEFLGRKVQGPAWRRMKCVRRTPGGQGPKRRSEQQEERAQTASVDLFAVNRPCAVRDVIGHLDKPAI